MQENLNPEPGSGSGSEILLKALGRLTRICQRPQKLVQAKNLRNPIHHFWLYLFTFDKDSRSSNAEPARKTIH
jgi:hypothetical protein